MSNKFFYGYIAGFVASWTALAIVLSSAITTGV